MENPTVTIPPALTTVPPASAGTDDHAGWLRNRSQALAVQLHAWRRLEQRWSWARLAFFFLAAVAWVPLRENLPAAVAASAVGAALFVVALVRHRAAQLRHDRVKHDVLVCKESLRRVNGSVVAVRPVGRPTEAGLKVPPLVSPGASWNLTEQERDDLDLYTSPTGVFGLLNRASTLIGARRLRDLLENPSLEAAEIRSRQEAVGALAQDHDLRLHLLSSISGLRWLDERMAGFEEAVAQAEPVQGRAAAWLARIWSIVSLALTAWALWRVAAGDARLVPVIGIVLAINAAILMPIWKSLRLALGLWEASTELARQYLQVAQTVSAHLPRKTSLATAREALAQVAQPAALPAALRWIEWSVSGGMIQAMLNLFFLYDLHMLEGILRHVLPHRAALQRGLSAVAEVEAALSLACFAAEQPGCCWPELVEGEILLSIKHGAHPLIDPQVGVANDLEMTADSNLVLITGSNMSGKSTFLRMVGVNALLAQAGSAVVAQQMRLSPLRLMSDLRIRDSLAKSESYFLAEVRHLKRMIVAPPGDVPILGLIDEPFRGTNHQEQRAATLAVVSHLKQSGGLYLIATHDRTVAHRLDGTVRNCHFQEELGETELVFDYRLREGITQSRNALRVLEREGYPRELVERANQWVDGAAELDDR